MPNLPVFSLSYERALELTRAHHAANSKTFDGRFTWKMRQQIRDLIQRHEAKTLLDYGCGKGWQYQQIDPMTGLTLHQMWNVDTFLYDPGVPEFSREPQGKYDIVICIQVLGSIPTADLHQVVDRLYGLANKAILVAERIGKSKKPIFEQMQDEMPMLSADEWMNCLRRPGHDVELLATFRPGWRWELPADQGALGGRDWRWREFT